MKLLFWNIRGLSSVASRQALRNFCHCHKPNFLFISEPWIQLSQVAPSFWNSINLKPFVVNDRGSQLSNLWLLCANHLNPDVISIS